MPKKLKVMILNKQKVFLVTKSNLQKLLLIIHLLKLHLMINKIFKLMCKLILKSSKQLKKILKI